MTIGARSTEERRDGLAERTPTSRLLFESARKVMPNGTSSAARILEPYPFFARRGVGGHIEDVDGNRYIDCRLGYGPMLVGHAHPHVLNAVQEVLGDGFVFGAPHRGEQLLAGKVVELSPCAESVAFCNSGTEATLHAIRVARALTGKEKIAKFEGGYQGIHDAVALNIHGAVGDDAAHIPPAPETMGIPASTQSLTRILPYNDERAFDVLEAEGDEIAAVLVEPMLGVGGALPADASFLRRLREMTTRLGIVLVFDEVITGFRLALGGGQERFGVQPDLVTYGKPVGGGFPIGVLAGRKDLMDLFDVFVAASERDGRKVMFGGTSNGNPISMAAGYATLEVLEREGRDGYDRLDAMGRRLRDEVNDHARRLGVAFHMTGMGPVFASHFVSRDDVPRSPRDLADEDKVLQKEYGLALLARGVFLNPTHAFLSFAHTAEDLDHIVSAHKGALEDVSA